MTKLTFSMADLRPIIEHAAASRVHRTPNEGSTLSKYLILVKDEGIYLMSAGDPRQLREGEDPEHGMSVVAYARGYDPEKDTDVWDKAHDAVGGDDFAEFLPLEWFQRALERGETSITLNFSSRSISVAMPRRRPR